MMMDSLTFTQRYLEVLNRDFAGLNLTRNLDPSEFEGLNVIDSLIPFHPELSIESSLPLQTPLLQLIESRDLIVDLGFGGGFPILPLANAFPQKKLIGLEARGKKVLAVRTISQYLGLQNVHLYHRRYETVLFDRPCLVVFKAVGDCFKVLSSLNFSGDEANVFLYKGPQFFEQEGNSLRQLEKEGWVLKDSFNYQLQVGGEVHGRLGVLLQKNKIVPRRTSAHNNLVKLSTFQ